MVIVINKGLREIHMPSEVALPGTKIFIKKVKPGVQTEVTDKEADILEKMYKDEFEFIRPQAFKNHEAQEEIKRGPGRPALK